MRNNSLIFLIILGMLIELPGVNAQQVTLSQARHLYFNIDKDECNGLKLAEQFESANSFNDPLLKAYYGASAAAAPVCVGNPVKKISWFNKGKELLDESVKSGMTIFEIRFLRFATQSKTPRFLNYRDNIEEDKKFLLGSLSKGKSQVSDKKAFDEMATFMLNSNELDQKDKIMVREFLLQISDTKHDLTE